MPQRSKKMPLIEREYSSLKQSKGKKTAVDNELSISTVQAVPELLDLPWDLSLDEWPDSLVVFLPKGISRHIVRFISLDENNIIAVKQLSEHAANNEYEMMRELDNLEAPSVHPCAIVTNRTDKTGKALDAAMVTYHLPYSLPYRALFQERLKEKTVNRLVKALALLMVRLHLFGFYWGDVSLSNVLFRRDAQELTAYLVDGETGEFHDELTQGQRINDLEIAKVNIIGEFFDLEAGNMLPEEVNPIKVGDLLTNTYKSLWEELTGVQKIDSSHPAINISQRIARLNELGFDVDEIDIAKDKKSSKILIKPKVVEAGYNSRRLFRLLGIEAGEFQARSLLNNFDSFRSIHYSKIPEEVVAHTWYAQRYRKTLDSIPESLRKKRTDPQLFHEILEHRWFLSEEKGKDVGLKNAVKSFGSKILPNERNESVIVENKTISNKKRI